MSILRSTTTTLARRAYATAASSTSAAPSLTTVSTRSNASAPILANIEASWKNMPADEQYDVYTQLEELQKRDWKELTVDEKKAGTSERAIDQGLSAVILELSVVSEPMECAL
jgi:hypothetical protein